MSEIIKRKITVIKEDVPFVKLTYCDECNRLIRQRVCTGFSNLRKVDTKNRIEWYQVTTGHDNKETDVCPDCIRAVFDRYLATSQGENDQGISVNHCWVYKEELMEDKNESVGS